MPGPGPQPKTTNIRRIRRICRMLLGLALCGCSQDTAPPLRIAAAAAGPDIELELTAPPGALVQIYAKRPWIGAAPVIPGLAGMLGRMDALPTDPTEGLGMLCAANSSGQPPQTVRLVAAMTQPWPDRVVIQALAHQLDPVPTLRLSNAVLATRHGDRWHVQPYASVDAAAEDWPARLAGALGLAALFMALRQWRRAPSTAWILAPLLAATMARGLTAPSVWARAGLATAPLFDVPSMEADLPQLERMLLPGLVATSAEVQARQAPDEPVAIVASGDPTTNSLTAAAQLRRSLQRATVHLFTPPDDFRGLVLCVDLPEGQVPGGDLVASTALGPLIRLGPR